MWQAVFLAMVLFAAPAFAGPIAVGDRLEIAGLADQHDQPGGVDDATRLILFTRDMGASEFVEEALSHDGAARLAKAGALWVADIARMPRVITRFFALPAMRKRPYRMLLDRDGTATAALPHEKGRVTLVFLDRRAVTRIAFADSAAQVAQALEAQP